MARDLTQNPFTKDELNQLGADIDSSGLKKWSASKPQEFVNYLKGQGFSDDEVEATFLKNFGTTTYNVDPNTNIATLNRQSPTSIRQRGVAKAKGYEQIFFSPEERKAAQVEYRPAPPQGEEPAPFYMSQEEAELPVPPETAFREPLYDAQTGQPLSMGPSMEEDAAASGSEEAQRELQAQADRAQKAYAPQGLPPTLTPKQLLRPVGFLAGATMEAGKELLAAPAAVAGGLTGKSTGEILRRAGRDFAGDEKAFIPAAKDALKVFAESVEDGMDKTFVDAARTEAADIIQGLATMVVRDVIPVLPGGERTASEFFNTGYKSGEGFIAGMPVMATFGLTVVNEALHGNFKQAADMMAAKPVTTALILYPLLKKGVIALSPKEAAWVERTAGGYYARKNAPSVTDSGAQASAERAAAAQRVYVNPLAQTTEVGTAMAEQTLAEARAKQAATRTALEQSTKEIPQDFTGAEVPEIVEGVPQRAPIRPRRTVLGLTEREIMSKSMAPTIEQEGAVAEFEAKAGDQVTPFDQYTQELKETFGEDVANQLRLDDIRNQPETRATAQILQANAKANNVRLSNTEAFDIAAKQIAARRLGDFFQGRSELAAAAPEVGTKGGRGIPGEKAAVETIAGQQRQAFQPGQDATLLTRQKPPQVSYKIDPKSGRVVSRKVAPTEQYMYGETAPSLSDTIKTERALSRVEKYLPEFVDMEKQGMFDDIPDAMKADLQILMDNAGVKTVGELVSDINFRKQVGKSTTVESQYIPDRILPATERLRANLINRFSNRAVTEGYLQNQLPVEIADQVVAVAVDIMQENSQALINSPLILKKLVQVLQDKYGINKVTATNLVEAIKADSKLRTPTVQVELPDGSIIDPVAMETNLAEAYKQIVDENPKLRLQVLEQVREEVTRKVEKLVFQETIRESARQQTLRPVGEDPVADLATKTVDDLRASKKGTGDPTSGIKPVIVCDERVFQETINQLRTSGTAISDTAADILSRYEDPQPQLVEAGIVPKGAKVSAGFNESMGSLVQATRQFGWAEKLFGDYKRNLTSRNLLSGVNNLTSNILLETMYYGDPTVVYEIANPKSSMRQMYTRFMQNAPKDAAEAITFQAMKETGIVDTNMLATELDMVDEAGLVAKAAGKLPVVGEGARKIFTKFDKAQDNFYRWGDSFFKVRSMLTEMNRAKGILERLPVGQKARFNTGIGREIIIDKLNDSQFGMVDANGNTVPLTPEQLEGILARGGARIAAEKFVDYGKRPLYLQRLEDLRYGPLGGPLITPFLTWQYKMMDGAMPYVRMGGEQVGVSKGARAGLPFGGRLVFKPGIGSSFADVGLIDTTTDLKTNMSIAGDAFMLAARRAQIFGAAENISQGEEDLVRKGASFSGKGMDPVLVYANQSDPRIIYGKNFSQLNFLNPTLMVADAVQTIGEQALPKLQKDTHPALRKYVERRNSGQDISTADILSLAGYGGSTLADAYDRIQEASQYGNSAVLKDLAVQYGTTIALGTYGNMLKTGLRSMDADKGAGRKPVDTEVKLDAFSQMVRDTLGFGYKEAYMWGSLKSKNPAEYLDKAYQEYQEALYKNLVQEFVTKFTAAKERGASPAELAQIRSDQQAALDEYKKIATEIGQNYKSIVMKQKGEQPPKGIPKPQVFPKMNRVLRTEPIPVQHRKTYNVNELESIPEPTAPTQTVP